MKKDKTSALYIHIPFCIKKCKYCDFTSFENYNFQEEYFTALKNEIMLQADIWKDNIFDTIFFGGGTPSSADANYIEDILKTVREYLYLDLKEVTIEANPGTVDENKLKHYIDLGIDRISFGMQAAQDELLKKIGRIHRFSDVPKSIELAKNTGFTNINVDLMSGLPTQSADDLMESVYKTYKMGVNHISMYSLKLEKGTVMHYEVMQNKTILPSEDYEYEMSKKARLELQKLGYMRYEVSNYAQNGSKCKHNLHYWHNDDYLGLGVSAASSKHGLRTINLSSIKEYAMAVEDKKLPYVEQKQSTDSEFAFETLMLGLRLTSGVNIKNYYNRHGIMLDRKFDKLIASLKKRGLIIFDNDVLYLTDKGMDIQNTVLVEFMDGFDF